MDAMGPSALNGVRVVELGEGVAAAYCGALLAACGADVVKVERPDTGDLVRSLPPFAPGIAAPEASGMQVFLDANKRSLALDCGTPEGVVLARRLVADADVLIEAKDPAFLDRLFSNGKDPRNAASDQVVLSLSWFGRSGPGRAWHSTDAVIQALSGFIYSIGSAEGPPMIPGGYQAQITAGLTAFIAVMAALIGRITGGGGCYIDQSVLEAQAAYGEPTAVRYSYDLVEQTRMGINRFSPVYPQTIYPAQDGWIGVTALTPAQWHACCELVGRRDLIDDARFTTARGRNQNADAIDEVLIPEFRKRPALEWFHEGQRRRIPLALVPDMADLADLDHFQAREVFARFEHPSVGTFHAPAIPWKLAATPLRRGGRAPRLGEHSREILVSRLEMTESNVAALAQKGVIQLNEVSI